MKAQILAGGPRPSAEGGLPPKAAALKAALRLRRRPSAEGGPPSKYYFPFFIAWVASGLWDFTATRLMFIGLWSKCV